MSTLIFADLLVQKDLLWSQKKRGRSNDVRSDFVRRAPAPWGPKSWGAGSADLHPHALDVGHLLDRRAPLHAAVARGLDAAVGHRRVAHLVRVDPHLPGAQGARCAVGAAQVVGPHAGAQ